MNKDKEIEHVKNDEIFNEELKNPKMLAITSLTLGILGIFLIPFVSLAAIILGYIARSEKYEKKYQKIAKSGIILGYVHVIMLIVGGILLITARAIMETF